MKKKVKKVLFTDDDYDHSSEKYGDQVINEEGIMELRNTKQRLQQQAKERQEKIKQSKKPEMTKEEFNEKWSLPAYLRRGVKMQDVPHSSEPFISKYNLNDDNNILGNNKFLHDNVD
jgi:cell division protein FtsZ